MIAIGNYIGKRVGSEVSIGSPSNLVLTVISDTQIQLNGISGSTDEDGFSWERSLTGYSGWSEIATTLAGVVSYLNTGLTPNTRYYYRFRAFKGSRYSAYSNIEFATTDIKTELIAGWKFENSAITTDYFQNTLSDFALNYVKIAAQCYNGKTYVTYQGADDDPYIMCYTHASNTWSAAVKVGTNPLVNGDQHGMPGFLIDNDGYLHVNFGSHQSAEVYYKSDNPEDITTWTLMGSPCTGTYTQMVQFSNDTIYCFYRSSNVTHKWGYKTSTDGGTSWSAFTEVFDGFAYAFFRKGVGDIIHCAVHGWYTNLFSRKNIYYCSFDGTDWKNATGSNQTLPMTGENNANILIHNSGTNYVPFPYIAFTDADVPYILFAEGTSADVNIAGTYTYKLIKFNGSTWDVRNLGTSTEFFVNGICYLDLKAGGNLDAYIVAEGDSINYGANIEKWISTDDGDTWVKEQTIMYGNQLLPQKIQNYNSKAKVIFSEWANDSTTFTRKGYVLGDEGFLRNNVLSDPYADIKGLSTLTPYNSPTIVAGQYGTAFQFAKASSKYLKADDANKFSFTNGSNDLPFSITMWIKTTDTNPAVYEFLLSKIMTNNLEWGCYMNTNKLWLIAYKDASNLIYASAPFTTVNQFVFLTFTYSGNGSQTGLKIYANALSIEDTQSVTGTYTKMTAASAPIGFGVKFAANDSSPVNYFNGIMDEVKIWNKALSIPEMTLVMNNDPSW